MSYIVWIGGFPDYEGNSKSMAQAIYSEWLAQGYEDVFLETIKGEL